MDLFQLESSSIGSTIIDPEAIVDEITEVKFEAHSEFDLNFFDTPDDSMTQAAFSSPNSVESSASPTPEPLTPTVIPNLTQQTKSNVSINQKEQNQNLASANVKNGKATYCRMLLSAPSSWQNPKETRTTFSFRQLTSLCSWLSRNCITTQHSLWISSLARSFAIMNYDNRINAKTLEARGSRRAAPEMGINK